MHRYYITYRTTKGYSTCYVFAPDRSGAVRGAIARGIHISAIMRCIRV